MEYVSCWAQMIVVIYKRHLIGTAAAVGREAQSAQVALLNLLFHDHPAWSVLSVLSD